MRSQYEPAQLPLLEALAAAPDEGIGEGRVEAAALAVFAHSAFTGLAELEIGFDDGRPRCDQLVRTLFSAYGRGLVERAGSTWRLSASGRSALEQAGIEPTAEARAIVAEALDRPLDELLAEIAETLSSRYAMIAAGDGQPLRV